VEALCYVTAHNYKDKIFPKPGEENLWVFLSILFRFLASILMAASSCGDNCIFLWIYNTLLLVIMSRF